MLRRARSDFVRERNLLRLLIGLCLVFALAPPCSAADQVEIKIGYLHVAPSRIRLSLMDIPAENDGLAGAQLAIDDNMTTGRFVNQRFTLLDKLFRPGEDVGALVGAMADDGAAFVVTDLDAETL